MGFCKSIVDHERHILPIVARDNCLKRMEYDVKNRRWTYAIPC